MKKIIAMFMVVVIVVTLFVGCGGTYHGESDYEGGEFVDVCYAKYRGSNRIVEVDSCFYYWDEDVYEITTNGVTRRVFGYEVQLYNYDPRDIE